MTILTPAQIAGYAKAAGFTGSQVTIMTAIALAESGGQTDVTHRNTNGSTDLGVWQINDNANSDVLTMGDWRNPADNARMAFTIYKRQGYQAWSVFNSKTYAKHLSTAATGASGAVTTLPTGIPNPVTGTVDAVKFLTDPHNWLRLAMFGGGVSLVMIALFSIGWNGAPPIVKTVAKAIVLKKAPLKGSTKTVAGAAAKARTAAPGGSPRA